MDRKWLAIGQIAKRAGVNASALRFYEQKGLIQSLRSEGGRRLYPQDALRRIAFIRVAQGMGLTLDEIAGALQGLPDGRTPDRHDWERIAGQWQTLLVQTRGADAVLEIGTSNGYSTLWLAEAVKRLGGRVTTIERDEGKLALAAHNFQRAGLESWIEQLAGEAGTLLPTLPAAAYQLSSSTPIAGTTRPGGPRSNACFPLAACWWWTTPSPTGRR